MRHFLTQRTLTGFTAAFAVFAALSGCNAKTEAEMAVRRVRGLLSEQKPCTFGKPGDCSADRVCAFVKPGQAECVKRYVGATPFVRFPFAPDHPVVCIQGTETPERANPRPHDTVESLYALDLASRDEQGQDAAPGIVYAGIDGTALVYRSCADGKPADDSDKTAPKPANDDPCGNGYGNHVRILNQDGIMVLYAHLGSIFLEDGQVVHAGEKIGREGKSGRAFRQHLHLSVHYTPMGENWLETLSYYRGTMGVVPPSIPFELQYCDPSKPGPDCFRKRTRMSEVPCSAEKAPPLRADWRN